MDHPCHKCGHSIEDGKAFCSQCGAPQIRVVVADALPATLLADDVYVPALPVNSEPAALGVPALRLVGTSTLQACGLAAVVSFGLMLLGLNFLVAALAAGFLAIPLTRRRSPGTLIRGSVGAKLGALSGLLFFGISTILNMLAVVFLHKGAEIRSEQLERLQQWAIRHPGPGVEPLLDFVKSADGFAIMLVASVILGLILVVALGCCGGALAASFWGRRNQP
jgi:hypothetical protein